MDEGEAFAVALGEKEAVMHSGQGLTQSRYPNQPGLLAGWDSACWFFGGKVQSGFSGLGSSKFKA